MSVVLLLEDGTGITGANAYEDETDTATRLTDLVYAAFDAIVAADTQKAFVFRATRTVDRMIKALAEDNQVFNWDTGLSQGQGLFYPRREADSPRIPEDIKLASAYQAEILALEDNASTNPLEAVSALPTGVLEAELAKGVRIKVSGNRIQSRAVEDLSNEVTLLLTGLIDLELKDTPVEVLVL